MINLLKNEEISLIERCIAYSATEVVLLLKKNNPLHLRLRLLSLKTCLPAVRPKPL